MNCSAERNLRDEQALGEAADFRFVAQCRLASASWAAARVSSMRS